ncbi:Hypothetical protein R9X50_00517000 [Acrodontium crateriforme]|uniref:Transcription initiation factor TFIID subunit 2 n=1 Tax=Acrodontium crateriforme TaxID=150365 RepID=A0AAQ3RD44_9PEZI|nr:Hypothetical protein R9X50_00517000 [Acrodontium crateriforme]
MPGFVEEVGEVPAQSPPEYTILKQRVDLDFDFAGRSLIGTTEITIQPLVRDLKNIRLQCRQCQPSAIQAGGITARFEYDDPYRRLRMPAAATSHQHEMLKEKIHKSLQPAPEPELLITLPSKLKIQELHVDPSTALSQYNSVSSLQKQETDALAALDTPTGAAPHGPQFAPIKLFIEFTVDNFRDGLHWVGFEELDKRFPYVYTKSEPWAGNSSCIFPCMDDATSRCSWEISITCPKTLGDAFRRTRPSAEHNHKVGQSADKDVEMANGMEDARTKRTSKSADDNKYLIDIDEVDAELELVVVCVGELADDVIDMDDESRHTVSFSLNDPVCARHIAFAIGPFEHVDLSTSRDAEAEERLGRSAVKVDAYCLPGRSEECRVTCFPMTRAIDYFGINYGSYPFSSYQMLFVDDFVHDTVAAAGLSICSSNLLFPYDIMEPLEQNTRKLIRSLADQWAGVNLVPKEQTDAWAVAGIAGFMADLYGKVLFGNNAYRWQQKLAAEKVYDDDVDRPSIYELGHLLKLDVSIRQFLDLKSTLVLFILDRRLMKSSGSTGVARIINRILLNARTGNLTNGELSTADFQRTCEKLGHNNKLEPFFRQWVFGSGCPIFLVQQKFNKKKLVVEMTITQMQLKRETKPAFEPSNFMREINEFVRDVWAPEPQAVFTGPMTIRIHEADGTPYEHIVDIKEGITKLDIPYNTKYKRLKRSRRQKERAMADGTQGEGGDDALLYCLGDILDSPEEVRSWNLAEWTPEDEEKMGQESYEWIRIDADFEWIGKIHLVMPLYMYISQLQQDRDLVAQYESMRYLLGSNPHHVSLTILVRTLMDRRYFHGIRAMAADGLAILAKDRVMEIGQYHLQKAFAELFCFPGEIMPKPNDWTDRTNYIIQCAIPKAMSKLRDETGKVPMAIRRFFVDKLKFNDNSNNEYSDCHYVATLMNCLSDSLVASHRKPEVMQVFHFGDDDDAIMEPENPDADFEKEAVGEIERYRRIDEWITTYQNVYSVTALKCLARLTTAGIVKDKTREVLQYTRSANADFVRLDAFRCLSETGVTRKMPMMKYLLHSIADAPSPFFRDRLTQIFGEALGHLALDDAKAALEAQAPPPPDNDGLVLEQEASNEALKLEANRKTSPEGALLALKSELSGDETFNKALWHVATSSYLSVDEIAAFCNIAALLYEPISSCRVVLRLPQSYRCEKVGKGLIKFIPHGAYRTVPRKPLAVDEWRMLQIYGLKYSGPLSSEARRAQYAPVQPAPPPPEDEVEALKRQIAQLSQQFPNPINTQTPIPMAPPSSIPTPTAEKSGIKLSFKRKPSDELTPRAGSPKSIKIAKYQTPGSTGQLPKIKRSPSISGPAKPTTAIPRRPSVTKSGSKLVRLGLSISGSSKVEKILSSKPQPGIMRPPQISGGLLHNKSLLSAPMSQSSNGNKLLSASPPTQSPVLNVGAFRTYELPQSTSSKAPQVKREKMESTPSQGMMNTPNRVEKSSSSSRDAPPSDAVQPPKKKFLLKLGKPSSQASSPQ